MMRRVLTPDSHTDIFAWIYIIVYRAIWVKLLQKSTFTSSLNLYYFLQGNVFSFGEDKVSKPMRLMVKKVSLHHKWLHVK